MIDKIKSEVLNIKKKRCYPDNLVDHVKKKLDKMNMIDKIKSEVLNIKKKRCYPVDLVDYIGKM